MQQSGRNEAGFFSLFWFFRSALGGSVRIATSADPTHTGKQSLSFCVHVGRLSRPSSPRYVVLSERGKLGVKRLGGGSNCSCGAHPSPPTRAKVFAPRGLGCGARTGNHTRTVGKNTHTVAHVALAELVFVVAYFCFGFLGSGLGLMVGTPIERGRARRWERRDERETRGPQETAVRAAS